MNLSQNMRLIAISFFISLATPFALGGDGNITEKESLPLTQTPDVHIQIVRQLGQNYEIKVFPNRVVQFFGKGRTKNYGEHRYQLSIKDYEELWNTIKKYNFPKMEADFNKVIAWQSENMPYATVTININGHQEKVDFRSSKRVVLFMRAMEDSIRSDRLRCPYFEFGIELCENETRGDDSIIQIDR